MVEVKPMDEEFMLPRCLHAGPIDAAAGEAFESGESDVPQHPWSDEMMRGLVARHPDFGLCDTGGGWAREFMRETIRRYGTCALPAWEEGKVVGFIRFYPMEIARMVDERRAGRAEPILDPTLACEPEDDAATLWAHCVMTSRPYTGTTAEVGPTSRRRCDLAHGGASRRQKGHRPETRKGAHPLGTRAWMEAGYQGCALRPRFLLRYMGRGREGVLGVGGVRGHRDDPPAPGMVRGGHGHASGSDGR